MGKQVIYAVPDFVEICWDGESQAVRLKWFSEYDEGRAVRDAVAFALDYVRRNAVPHWVGDLSSSRAGLSAADQEWVGTDFKKEIANTPLRRLVLVPPRRETGQDISWLGEWEAKTRAEFVIVSMPGCSGTRTR